LPKLPSFSPKLTGKSNSKKEETSPNKNQPAVDNLILVLQTHQAHKMQVKDTEMKSRLSSGPTREQIALATDASRVLNSENESGGHRHRSSEDELFGGEHSALLDLLRQDERLSGLL